MRAVVFDRFGEPDEVLDVRDIDEPAPAAGQVLVRMLASPVNPSDLMTIRGIYGNTPQLPFTPGYEGVGVVEASGGGLLGKLHVGKRVALLNSDRGNWAEKTVVSAKQAIPVPDALPVEQAAMFFVNPMTSFVMTRKVLAIPKEAWLLQTAAGSALGRMVIRLGKIFGFRTLNVVRREAQADELKSLGGDEVLVFDAEHSDPQQFRENVLRITGGGARFAIDPVGGATGSAAIECLGPDGRMLVYGTLSGEPLSFSPRVLMGRGARVEGFWLARWLPAQGLLTKLSLVKTVTKLIRDGTLISEIGETYELAQITEAVRKSEEPGRGGKVLVHLGDR